MLRWLVGSLAVLTLTSLLMARDGTVVTKDGQSYDGDITEKGDTVEIKSADVTGPIGIKKANVQSIQYVDDTAATVKANLAKLDKRDIKARLALAHQAFDGRAYEVARQALTEAQAIEPNNREAADLLAQVNKHVAPASQPTTPEPAPGVAPAPGPATKPAADVYLAKREVTPEEINRIRQVEWRKDEPIPIKVRIDRDVVGKFLMTYPDMTRQEFARLPADQQGSLILSKGKPELRTGVHVESDPASILEYRKNVHRVVIVQGCAVAGCHNGGKAGTFNLVGGNTDAAVYTDYLILQKYSKAIAPKAGDPGKPVQHSVVDREYPDQSLLLQYMLPPAAADLPHPAVGNYKGAVKTASAPGYVQTLHWISQLNPIAPDYDIDLSKDPPKKEPKDTKPAP